VEDSKTVTRRQAFLFPNRNFFQGSDENILFFVYVMALLMGQVAISFVYLKGPKREIFDSGVFAQIRPIWIGDLGTRPKNY
jgi:hypothetical protein